MYLHYVHIALVLKQEVPNRCIFSELMVDPERGEAKGFDEEFLDTLILRCAAT